MVGVFPFLISMLLIAILAGFVGAMVGVGGGILVVPSLTLLFGVPIEYAIGASIISVIATSSGSASAYVRDRITNLRIGMFLEIGSTIGALVGAVSALALVKSGLSAVVFLVFGFVLFFTAYSSVNRIRKERVRTAEMVNRKPNPISERLKLGGEYYDVALKTRTEYIADKVPAAFSVMLVAGVLSGLLGIGGGVLKVVGMDSLMKLPFKVSTTTSNFMLGITAAVTTGIFYVGGFVNPIIAAPIAVGVLIGSFVGAKVLVRSRPILLRWLFVVVLIALGIQMIHEGLIL